MSKGKRGAGLYLPTTLTVFPDQNNPLTSCGSQKLFCQIAVLRSLSKEDSKNEGHKNTMDANRGS